MVPSGARRAWIHWSWRLSNVAVARPACRLVAVRRAGEVIDDGRDEGPEQAGGGGGRRRRPSVDESAAGRGHGAREGGEPLGVRALDHGPPDGAVGAPRAPPRSARTDGATTRPAANCSAAAANARSLPTNTPAASDSLPTQAARNEAASAGANVQAVSVQGRRAGCARGRRLGDERAGGDGCALHRRQPAGDGCRRSGGG